ncbi:MAG TPA: ubiquinol-cytochrome c reductase iron-sulfur subunit [Burkholderiales bacterium]|jgi:ubiquinol-cytochrome c reductase iron-sulfur subunit|nr:ubiquinol-cytochrome c reductase iron-sulfur subunit [Burkholderiales bacterium]
MSEHGVNKGKRDFLVAATSVVGGIAAGATAVPFAGSMFPSERAKAAGAPVEADISKLAPGGMQIIEWRGKPVWIVRRTQEMLDSIQKDNNLVADPKSEVPQQPAYAKNEFRSIKPDIAVLIGVCTHLGCSPQFKSADAKGDMGMEWNGGFYCPCHGSKFDLAGRVFKGVPAPINLEVPQYKFVGDNKIIIGDDTKGA